MSGTVVLVNVAVLAAAEVSTASVNSKRGVGDGGRISLKSGNSEGRGISDAGSSRPMLSIRCENSEYGNSAPGCGGLCMCCVGIDTLGTGREIIKCSRTVSRTKSCTRLPW